MGVLKLIKGVYKNIVVIKSPKSDIIEEAIFIIKPEAGKRGVQKTDMLTEAIKLLKNDTDIEAKTSIPSFRKMGK